MFLDDPERLLDIFFIKKNILKSEAFLITLTYSSSLSNNLVIEPATNDLLMSLTRLEC